MLHSTNNTLQQREERYGSFATQGAVAQNFKTVMRMTMGWNDLSPCQKESLEMIVHKIGRILNGDPNYADSWHDIAGYATLIDKQLGGH
jgi:hypothetical protein